jgi:hypothetical protein
MDYICVVWQAITFELLTLNFDLDRANMQGRIKA